MSYLFTRQNPLIKIANTECLLKSLLNYKMYPKQTQKISQHTVSALFTHKNPLSKIDYTKCLIKSLFNDQMHPQKPSKLSNI